MFWFHPLVWWIGARLVEERERACDEAVLSLGSEPGDYAEGVLAVCKSYLESPLYCVSGVTGSNLKKRIQVILSGRMPGALSSVKKVVLVLAGIGAVAGPVGVGMLNAPVILALSSSADAPKFEVASIKPCEAFRNRPVPGTPGRLQSGCTTLQRLMRQAYGVFANGQENLLSSLTITGGPAWTDSEFYEIDAKTEATEPWETMNGPMLQALLEDRFKLKIHRETRDVPVYALTVATDGVKMPPFQGNCISSDAWDYYHPPAPSLRCGGSRLTKDGVDVTGATMADLCFFFLVTLDRPVIDETGITGRFDYHLGLSAEDMEFFHHGAHGVPARGNPATPPAPASFVSAIKTAVIQLGLKLEPTNGPGQFIIIDSVARPSENQR